MALQLTAASGSPPVSAGDHLGPFNPSHENASLRHVLSHSHIPHTRRAETAQRDAAQDARQPAFESTSPQSQQQRGASENASETEQYGRDRLVLLDSAVAPLCCLKLIPFDAVLLRRRIFLLLHI